MTEEQSPTIDELAIRLARFIPTEAWHSARVTTTQVKLGVDALAELVARLERASDCAGCTYEGVTCTLCEVYGEDS